MQAKQENWPHRLKRQKNEFYSQTEQLYCFKYQDKYGNWKRIRCKSLEGLRKRENDIRRMQAQGIDIANAQNATLNQLFHDSIEIKETTAQIKSTTISNYKTKWKTHVEGTLGKLRLTQITPLIISRQLGKWIDQGLSNGTIKNLVMIMSSAFDEAIESQLVSYNPFKTKAVRKAKSGGTAPKPRDALTVDQQTRLEDYVAENPTYSIYSPMLTIMLNTGLRAGEVCGLCWTDIKSISDPTRPKIRGEIIITQQLKYDPTPDNPHCHYFWDTPKSKSGIRRIPYGEEVAEALEALKQLYNVLQIKSTLSVDGVSDFVFLNQAGRPYCRNRLGSLVKEIIKAYNKDNPDSPLPLISPHIMRHTYGTRNAEKGVNLKVIQKLMGHSDIQTTGNIYVSADESFILDELCRVAQ